MKYGTGKELTVGEIFSDPSSNSEQGRSRPTPFQKENPDVEARHTEYIPGVDERKGEGDPQKKNLR